MTPSTKLRTYELQFSGATVTCPAPPTTTRARASRQLLHFSHRFSLQICQVSVLVQSSGSSGSFAGREFVKESSEFGVRDKYEAQICKSVGPNLPWLQFNFTDLQFLSERWVSFFPTCCQRFGQWCVISIYHCGRRRCARRRVPAPRSAKPTTLGIQ